jgi:hypothetical protein
MQPTSLEHGVDKQSRLECTCLLHVPVATGILVRQVITYAAAQPSLNEAQDLEARRLNGEVMDLLVNTLIALLHLGSASTTAHQGLPQATWRNLLDLTGGTLR